MNHTDSVPKRFDRDAVRRVILEALVEGRSLVGVVADDTPLGEGGLEVGSLPLLHAFVRIEKVLGLEFDDFSVANVKLTNVGDLVQFVDQALRTKTSIASVGAR